MQEDLYHEEQVNNQFMFGQKEEAKENHNILIDLNPQNENAVN